MMFRSITWIQISGCLLALAACGKGDATKDKPANEPSTEERAPAPKPVEVPTLTITAKLRAPWTIDIPDKHTVDKFMDKDTTWNVLAPGWTHPIANVSWGNPKAASRTDLIKGFCGDTENVKWTKLSEGRELVRCTSPADAHRFQLVVDEADGTIVCDGSAEGKNAGDPLSMEKVELAVAICKTLRKAE